MEPPDGLFVQLVLYYVNPFELHISLGHKLMECICQKKSSKLEAYKPVYTFKIKVKASYYNVHLYIQLLISLVIMFYDMALLINVHRNHFVSIVLNIM